MQIDPATPIIGPLLPPSIPGRHPANPQVRTKYHE